MPLPLMAFSWKAEPDIGAVAIPESGQRIGNLLDPFRVGAVIDMRQLIKEHPFNGLKLSRKSGPESWFELRAGHQLAKDNGIPGTIILTSRAKVEIEQLL